MHMVLAFDSFHWTYPDIWNHLCKYCEIIKHCDNDDELSSIRLTLSLGWQGAAARRACNIIMSYQEGRRGSSHVQLPSSYHRLWFTIGEWPAYHRLIKSSFHHIIISPVICEPGHRRDGRGGSVAGLMRSTTLLRMVIVREMVKMIIMIMMMVRHKRLLRMMFTILLHESLSGYIWNTLGQMLLCTGIIGPAKVKPRSLPRVSLRARIF